MNWKKILEYIDSNLKWPVISGLIIGGSVAWSDKDGFEVSKFIIGVGPGLIVGMLISTIANSRKQLNQLLPTLTETVDEIVKLRKCESFDNVKEILEATQGSNEYMNNLLKKAKEHYCNLPKKSPQDFYAILTDGFDKVNQWDGIHYGSIELLGSNPPNQNGASTYFKSIEKRAKKKNDPFKARRIIISNEDDFSDKNIFNEFWSKAGKYADNYLISEEDMYHITGLSQDDDLGDCALYDKVVFLHYDRKNTVTFAYPGSAFDKYIAVDKLYTALEETLVGTNSVGRFYKINPDQSLKEI